MDDAHDRLTEEARATASALLDWLGSRVDRAAAPGGPGARPAQSPGPCTWCPVCAVVAALRGEQPELTARVAEQASGLMMLLRLMVQSHAGPGHDHGHDHGFEADLGWPPAGWETPEEPAAPADEPVDELADDPADDTADLPHRPARPTPRRAPARTTSPRASAPHTGASRATAPNRPARGRTGPRPAPRRTPVEQPSDAPTGTPVDRPADAAPPAAPAAPTSSPDPRPGQRRPVQRIPIRRPTDPSP